MASTRSTGSKKSKSGKQSPKQGEAPPTTTYTVAVRTSDVRNVVIDANVYIQLIEEAGIGPQVQLKTSLNHRNKFERKHSDVFVFHDQKALGALKQLKIWHDNSGVGPGWHLDVVEVNDAAQGVSYALPCGKWLCKKEGDHQICRMLNCARTKQKMPKQLQVAADMAKQQGGSTLQIRSGNTRVSWTGLATVAITRSRTVASDGSRTAAGSGTRTVAAAGPRPVATTGSGTVAPARFMAAMAVGSRKDTIWCSRQVGGSAPLLVEWAEE